MLQDHILGLINSGNVPNWLSFQGEDLQKWLNEHAISEDGLHSEITKGITIQGELPVYFRLAKPPYAKCQLYYDGFYFPVYLKFPESAMTDQETVAWFFETIKKSYSAVFCKSMYGESAVAYTIAYLSKGEKDGEFSIRMFDADKGLVLETEPQAASMIDFVFSLASKKN